jgi:hypothetical protein
MLTIHFSRSFVGEAFYQLPECGLINEFLDKARLGIRITGQTQQEISSHLLSLRYQDGINRIITLLIILERLSRSDEIVPLASAGFVNAYSDQGTERINQVYLHVIITFPIIYPCGKLPPLRTSAKRPFAVISSPKQGKSFSHIPERNKDWLRL